MVLKDTPHFTLKNTKIYELDKKALFKLFSQHGVTCRKRNILKSPKPFGIEQ